MEHAVSESTLKRFASGSATPEENRAVVRHFLRGCVSCAERLRESECAEIPAGAYDAGLDRFEAGLRGKVKPRPAASKIVARLLV